jgi:hypothetical protein
VVFGVLAAIAGGFAYYFSSRVDIQKDSAFARFRLESTERIAAANSAAAEANERAKRYESDIASANSRAAEAMRIAEQERLARVKIEERLAWLDLSPEQEKSLSSKMQPFTGQRFKLITYQDDSRNVEVDR